MLPEDIADIVAAIAVISTIGMFGLTLAGLAYIGWRAAKWRGLAWVVVGIAGLPIMLISLLYLVGFVAIPSLMIVGLGVARWWRPLVDWIVIVVLGAFAAYALLMHVALGADGAAATLYVSFAAAVFASVRVGCAIAHGAMTRHSDRRVRVVPSSVTARWRV